jgi:hypothetical protein
METPRAALTAEFELLGRLLDFRSADLRRSHRRGDHARSRSTAADHKASLALVISGSLGMAGHPDAVDILIANFTD